MVLRFTRPQLMQTSSKMPGSVQVSACTVAVDEITSEADCMGLLHAARCGVSLVATAHAGSKSDLYTRPVYKPLISGNIFDMLVILQKDKSWSVERMEHI